MRKHYTVRQRGQWKERFDAATVFLPDNHMSIRNYAKTTIDLMLNL